MRALGPAAAFRGSIALLERRPWSALSLGLALYVSTASVCCGFGVVAAPWFSCELFALLLSTGTGEPLKRNQTWLWAGLVQMFTVVVLTSVASLALMSLGAMGGGSAAGESLSMRLGQGLLVGVVAGGLVLSVTVYFAHAPSILIDRGGGFIAALLESARLVSLYGTMRTWITCALSYGLPVLGVVLVLGSLALRASLAATVGFILLFLPVLVVSSLIGQGMLVASYLHLREEVTDPAEVLPGSEPSKGGAAVWVILLSLTALGPVLVSFSLLKPSLPEPSTLSANEEVVFWSGAAEPARTLYLPHTALTVHVSRTSVRVTASDGGGVGEVPLPGARVRAVRIAPAVAPQLARSLPRAEATWGIEVELADGRKFTTWIDEAGVRLDDTWERRLAQRLSPSGALSLVLCFAWTAFWITRSLPPQARIRRKLAGKRPSPVDAQHEQRLRSALRMRVMAAALWLLPPALLSLAIGLSALWR